MLGPDGLRTSSRVAALGLLAAIVVLAPLVGAFALSPIVVAFGIQPYPLAAAIGVMAAEAATLAAAILLTRKPR